MKDVNTTTALAFREHKKLLWGVCYRMMGCAADADELVQETFQRVLEKPPVDLSKSMKPWLLKVAMNLCRDRLRRRKKQEYIGVWIPSPVERHMLDLDDVSTDVEFQYSTFESVSFAFLLVLELLTPLKRAVFVLRDICDYSGQETADVLGITETNVRTTLRRARKEIEHHRGQHCDVLATPELSMKILEQFVQSLALGDVDKLESLLCHDVQLLTDSAGEYKAARRTIFGAVDVIKLLQYLRSVRSLPRAMAMRLLNGSASIVFVFPVDTKGFADKVVLSLDVNRDGRIRRIYSIQATRKLTGLDWTELLG